MKKGFKALLLLLIIVLVVGAIIFFVIKGSKTHEATDEEVEISNKIALKTIAKLYYGHCTPYYAIDLLYEKDKVTYEDLSTGNILMSAVNYISDNKLDSSISSVVEESINRKYKLSITDYTPYNGETIRTAIKEIYGIDWEDKGTEEIEINFKFNFIYIEEFDTYYMGVNEKYKEITKDNNYNVVFDTISTTVKDDKLLTEIAVAYVFNNDGTFEYASDAQLNNVVFEAKELKSKLDSQDKFNKYVITLKKSNNSYVFESITKK